MSVPSERSPLFGRGTLDQEAGSRDVGSAGANMAAVARQAVTERGRRVRRTLVLVAIGTALLLLLFISYSRESGNKSYAGPGGAGGTQETNETQDRVLREIRAFINPQEDPCEDFYAYACGGFLRSQPIPPNEARWGTSDLMEERCSDALLPMVQALRSGRAVSRTASEQRVVDFFDACFAAGQPSAADIERSGEDGLANDASSELLNASGFGRILSQLETIADPTELFAILGEMHRSVVDPGGNLPRPFFSYEVLPDGMHPEVMVLTIEQGGLGLPTRDYYLDEYYKDILDEYSNHIGRMLTLSGTDQAEAMQAAANIVEWETELAKASEAEADLGDDAWAVYNPTNLTALQHEMAPAIPWTNYLESLLAGTGKNASAIPLVVQWPPFLKRLSDMVALSSISNETRKLSLYLRWHVLNAMAGAAGNSSLAAEHFRFFGQIVEGRRGLANLSSQCLALADAHIGDDLGRLYVQRFFSPELRGKAVELIRSIEEEFAVILKRDDGAWLGRSSLRAALEKLRLVQNNIGYPDRWPDYDTLHLNGSDLLGDVFLCRQFRNDAILKQIGGPRNPSLWDMTPITVNAYYDPLSNSMNIPAANFAPNFYSALYPEAVNYGALGNVIGHELGHAFDSGGRHYDAHGRLSNWMSPQAVQEYDRRAKCMTNLYDHFRVNGRPVNGRLTLQENLADLTGMKTAYAAYNRLVKEHLTEAARHREWNLTRRIRPDWTPEQLYFVAFAQTWCENETPKYAMEGLVVDVHAPNRYRVNGILSQFPEFAEAFRCRSGSAMHPRKVCALW